MNSILHGKLLFILAFWAKESLNYKQDGSNTSCRSWVCAWHDNEIISDLLCFSHPDSSSNFAVSCIRMRPGYMRAPFKI